MPTPNMANPDVIAEMSLELYFHCLLMRLDGPKAADVSLALNVLFMDTGTAYLLEAGNGVLEILGRTATR